MTDNPYQAPRSVRRPDDSAVRRSGTFASFWARFAAQLIDGIITGVGVFIIGLIVFGERLLSADEEPPMYTAMSYLLPMVYTILFWMSRGATPGKMALGIVVVDSDGQHLGLGPCLLRYVGYLVSSIPLALGYFWMLWDRNSQTWHDKFAGSYVVVTRGGSTRRRRSPASTRSSHRRRAE